MAVTRGVPAYVVMPKRASAVKRAAIERYGAQVTLCDNTLDARRAVLAEVLDRTGAVEIHPFDNARVIAGRAPRRWSSSTRSPTSTWS